MPTRPSRVGRRRRNPRHVADVLVAIRLTPAERAAFQRLADDDEVSLSDLIRGLCTAELDRRTRRRSRTRSTGTVARSGTRTGS